MPDALAVSMTPAFSRDTRLLVVAPHPDDETIATGLLIQQVLAAGGVVHLLLLTNGDNNPWPQRWLERRLRIGEAGRHRLGARRRQELQQAMARLGLAPDALTALDWSDQGLTRRLQTELEPSITRLREVLDDFAPTWVAMPALGDRHPDHGAAHVLMRLALAGRTHPPLCLLYGVHGHEAAETACAWPADPRWAAEKAAALECHASQLALGATRVRRMARRHERFECLTLPATSQAGPDWSPPRMAWPWLSLIIATGAGVRTVPWARAPVELAALRTAFSSDRFDSRAPCFVKLQSSLPSPWIFDHWGWREL